MGDRVRGIIASLRQGRRALERQLAVLQAVSTPAPAGFVEALAKTSLRVLPGGRGRHER
jgi:hypothetical protein